MVILFKYASTDYLPQNTMVGKKMDRRKFISASVKAGIGAAAALSFGTPPKILANVSKTSQESVYDLAAIRGGEPDAMFDRAINSLGGIKKFVKPNQKVVIKPNIGWNAPPERAANTNPVLVKRIVEHCEQAGAKEIYIFDHTCDEWQRCYKTSGIENAIKGTKAKLIPGNNERYYQDIKIDKAVSLKESEIHEILLETDVFINVPVLKDHSGTDLSIGMKNLMGVCYDRRYWHRNDLHQCIADYPLYKKPDLTVVDAYNVMKKNGPRGVSVADVMMYKSQIISADIVAADAASAKLFGSDPMDIGYIKIAGEMGLGETDLAKLSIDRIKI